MLMIFILPAVYVPEHSWNINLLYTLIVCYSCMAPTFSFKWNREVLDSLSLSCKVNTCSFQYTNCTPLLHDLTPLWYTGDDDDCFCIALVSTLQQTHCFFVAFDSKWVTVTFYSMFWISTEVVYLQCCLLVTGRVPCETAAALALSVYTIQPSTSLCYFMQSQTCRVNVSLAVICNLHFWQNDWDHLCATSVTQG